MKTEAAVLVDIGKPLEIRELTIPDLKPGQVLVDVAYSGVCHSQLLEIDGKRGADRFLPHVLGHEGSGVVVAVGVGVEKVRAGDHVVLSWIKGTGRDEPSTRYESSSQRINSGAISTFMRRTVSCENRVTPIPADIPLRDASLLGCAIPTGAGIVINTIQARAGQSIAVFGAGGIGLSAILAAAYVGATPIIAIDVYDHKLELAKRMGATHVINAAQKDPHGEIVEITTGLGVDFAIECAGHRKTMESAYESTRYNGGLCILAGNLAHQERISIDPMDLIKGRRIAGTWGGETQPDRDIPVYIAAYRTGRFPMDRMITSIYSLSSINNAFNDLRSGNVGRALVDMSL